MREASFDDSDRAFKRFSRSQQEMDVIGHDDECVKLIALFGSVMPESFDKKFCVALDLKEAAAVQGRACNEVRSGARSSAGDRHRAIVSVPQGLKSLCDCGLLLLLLLKSCWV